MPAIEGALAAMPINGRITLSGYEGSELLVGRLLVESGADCAMSARHSPNAFSDPDREWLEAQGVHVQFRASLEQDLAAMAEFEPDLAIGTTPVVQKAKELRSRALLHQSDFCPSADGAGWCWVPGDRHQCRARQQRAVRHHDRLLRRCRQR
jgi:hypothetical protein